MPFKSRAQQGFFFSAEKRGDLPKGTAKKWADATPNIKKLPERVAGSRSSVTNSAPRPARVTAPAKKLPTRGTKPRAAGGNKIPKQRAAGVRSVSRT